MARALSCCLVLVLSACRPSGARVARAGDGELPVPPFVDLLARGRHDDAFALTCPEYREGRSVEGFRAALASLPYLDGLSDPAVASSEAGAGTQVDRVRFRGRHGPLELSLHSRPGEGGGCVAGLEVFGVELLWRAPARGRAAAAEQGEPPEGEDDGPPRSGPTVEVLLESQPTEARVFRVDDGFVCTTPCRLDLPRGREVALRFELSGYRPEVRTIAPERDTVVLVTLAAAR